MKQRIMGIIAVVAITAVAGYNVYNLQNDVNLSNLALANVEALADDGEGSGDKKFVVPWTEEVSREDNGNSIIVTYKHIVRCPHGGYSDCTPSEKTTQVTVPKG